MKKLLLFLFVSTNLALAQTFNYNGINYQVTDVTNFYVKVGTNSTFSGVANIPETVSYNSQNYTVNEIEYGAFSYCNGITSVTIPSTVTSISGSAFRNSPNLTSVIIPSSVISIGNSTFYGCTGLTSITIPSSVTFIDEYSFTSCTGLTSLTIPSSVTFIGYLAFSGCTGLTSLIVESSSIGSSSFYQCTGLVSVTINTNGIIGTNAFNQCTALTTLTITSAIAIGDNAFNGCSSLNTVNCYITTPLLISYNVFSGVNITSCTLNVPIGSEAAYEANSVWTDFNPINGNLLATDSFVKDNFSIYPNPFKNELFIDVKNLTNTQLDVLDINEKMLFNQTLNTNNIINTGNLSNGMYLFKVTSNEGSVTTKVIKN